MSIRQSTKYLSVLSFCLLIVSSLVAKAEDSTSTATPYRPTVSNPATLSAPGWLEMELGWQTIKGGGDKWRNSLPFLAKLAFTDDWGVLVGNELAVRRTDFDDAKYEGVGDTTLIVKHRISSGVEGIDWGVEAGYKLPTAKDTIGSGKGDFILNGIYSADFSASHLDLNLGATRLGAIDDGDGRLQYNWAASVSHNLNEKWGVFGELSGVYQHNASTQFQLMTGASYNYSNRIVLDAGLTVGLATASQDWSIFSGVTVLLDNLW
ncbi:transporter [Methylotenera sp.]|uniref:transporter n=1 Tax=Methylotenera sp. TaxID=2051956 RepID=UPI00248A8B27|nr:transporter [Methylotenera sp.]MDI1299891.1 transporter [Methylotenera sp.]